MKLKLIVAGLVLGIASVGIATPASAAPTTRVVGPGQAYSTIQAAVFASSNGDVVQVQPGTYVENVMIIGRYITVEAPNGATISAASAGMATVFIANVPYIVGRSTKLSGFTITGGNGSGGHGGGITVYQNASPEIFNNTITGNNAQAYGGGIAIFDNAHPIIRNNTIQSNTAVSGGAGIFVVNSSSPVIYGNTISGNTTTGASIPNGGSSGGGIYVENTADSSQRSYPVILNNTISNNSAEFAGGGIMVRTGANVVIEGNTITGNVAAYGGGIHLESTGSTATVTSNTITGNSAMANGKFAGSGWGGGIAIYDSTVATLKSNTIRGNASSSGGGGISIAENASVTLEANVISENRTGESLSGNQEGGGVYIANATMSAWNNQFIANRADRGGAIGLFDNSTSTIFNNTIVGNLEPALGGGAIFVRDSPGLTATISNNIITQNQGFQLYEESPRATIRSNIITTPSSTPSESGAGVYYSPVTNGLATSAALNAAGAANADSNSDGTPGFVDSSAGNYQLTATSAAIDLADPSGLRPVTTDFRGAIRDKTHVDAGAFEYLVAPLIPQSVYRFWSDTNKGHFYTLSVGERDQVASNYPPSQWRYEGFAYTAFSTQVPGTTALYRFFSYDYQGHFFTASAEEKDGVIATYPDHEWHYEGVAYYVYPAGATTGPAAQSKAVFRFWSPDNKHHFFTASEAESIYVQNTYPDHEWRYEGERFRVPD